MTYELRALIAAPDSSARDALLSLLRAQGGVAVQHVCDDRLACESILHRHETDLLFFDASLRARDGIRPFARADGPLVVVTSGERSDAAAAFDGGAVDFLLAPYSTRRCAEALSKARRLLAREEALGLTRRLLALLSDAGAPMERLEPAPTFPSQLVVSSGMRSTVVLTSSIDWIAADDAYARAWVGGESHLLRETLGSLAGRLDPRRFVRTHRSSLVNVSRIQELRRGPNGQCQIVLESGVTLPVSKRRRQHVTRAIGVNRHRSPT